MVDAGERGERRSPVGLLRACWAAGEEEDWCVRSIEDRDLAERGLVMGDITPTHHTHVSVCCEWVCRCEAEEGGKRVMLTFGAATCIGLILPCC